MKFLPAREEEDAWTSSPAEDGRRGAVDVSTEEHPLTEREETQEGGERESE